MTTIQYLNQADRWSKDINNRLSEIWQLEQLVTSIGVVTKEINVQTFGDKDKLGATVAKIVDKEQELSKYIDDVVIRKDKIIGQIRSLSDAMSSQVLFSRYIEQKTFEDIAGENDYSVRQIYRIHDKAIGNFEKLYGKSYENL